MINFDSALVRILNIVPMICLILKQIIYGWHDIKKTERFASKFMLKLKLFRQLYGFFFFPLMSCITQLFP